MSITIYPAAQYPFALDLMLISPPPSLHYATPLALPSSNAASLHILGHSSIALMEHDSNPTCVCVHVQMNERLAESSEQLNEILQEKESTIEDLTTRAQSLQNEIDNLTEYTVNLEVRLCNIDLRFSTVICVCACSYIWCTG